MIYVNVVLDNNSENTDVFYTYGYEDSQKPIYVGQKVMVKFGKGKNLREAYVVEVKVEPAEPIKGLKYIEEVCEDVELSEEMIETAIWMKNRYLCRYIEAIKCFLPAGKASQTGKKRKAYESMRISDRLKEEKTLNQEQQSTLRRISAVLGRDEKKIFLLHGITGSGKTEIYIESIIKNMELGRSAVVLVPEIALTTQLIERFAARFGTEAIAVLHSKLSLGQRYDEWQRIRKGEVQIVIGARSAVFAPLKNIGLIILDEEHEATYKADMSPKYDTLEVAVKRARILGATVILGSATPSVISNYRAETGIYEKLEMNNRYNGNRLPKVEVVDMAQELKNGNKSIFSEALYTQMRENLEAGKQVILFLNRRGYSYFISCRDCGYAVKCDECDISMTYHKKDNVAICHYCGKKQLVPEICPECGSKHIKYFGTGTEKVEEAVMELFPEYSVDRLDVDTIKTKGSMDRIIRDFQKGKTRILIGTQLVAKGLDFENVGLVGIVMADVSLNIPDYRAAERTFQLITQAAGRAGRGKDRGRVIVQSYTGGHYAISAAVEAAYQEFYEREIAIRRSLSYPPFSDLIQVIVVAKEEADGSRKATELQKILQEALSKEEGVHVYKMQKLVSNPVKEHFRYGIMVKSPKGRRNICLNLINKYKISINRNPKSEAVLLVDINPY